MTSKRTLLAVGTTLAVLLLTACTGWSSISRPAPAAPGAGTARILFTAEGKGIRDLFAINPDGTGLAQLTDSPGQEWYPAWSPDGSRIAFTYYDGQLTEIYVMDADGSNPKRQTYNATFEGSLAWSPDGKQIAFASNRNDPDLANCNNTAQGCISNIFVIDLESLAETQLTPSEFSFDGPAWSPDGKKIAFFSSGPGGRDIYMMNADGSNRKILDESPSMDWSPDWSPDGKKIAFMSNRDFENYQIFVMNADGTSLTRITSIESDASMPDWSPDGKKIVFYKWKTENTVLCTIDADGQNAACLEVMDSFYKRPFMPSWQPRR